MLRYHTSLTPLWPLILLLEGRTLFLLSLFLLGIRLPGRPWNLKQERRCMLVSQILLSGLTLTYCDVYLQRNLQGSLEVLCIFGQIRAVYDDTIIVVFPISERHLLLRIVRLTGLKLLQRHQAYSKPVCRQLLICVQVSFPARPVCGLSPQTKKLLFN